jgi:hypothetical protein
VIDGFVAGLQQPEYMRRTHCAGGKIRHGEFRNEPAPPIKSQED